jgi:hypothetical protein
VLRERATTFGAPADPERTSVRINALFTYANLDTGRTATDQGRFMFTIDGSEGTIVVRGLHVQLRDASGRLIDVAAGRIAFDPNTGELLEFTPNTQLDYADAVCRAIGGQPSSL